MSKETNSAEVLLNQNVTPEQFDCQLVIINFKLFENIVGFKYFS